MAIVCEPLKDKVLLKDQIEKHDPKTVLLIFWHGIGDLVMFLKVFEEIQAIWPDIGFAIGLPKGLTHEQLLHSESYDLVTAEEVNDYPELLPYDMVAKITFPMNEGQMELTKAEWCCVHEIGIEPVWGHNRLSKGTNRLVGVHFNITCLPDSCNPDKETAERIWNDILEAGYIPIETHFTHVFHNPVNEKFDFVDCSVRRAKAQVSSLVGLLRSCRAFIGVVSGNFHVALSVLPKDRIMLLEKDFKRECFTKYDIARCSLKEYDGKVKTWLEDMQNG